MAETDGRPICQQRASVRHARQAPDAGGTGPTKASIDARVKVAKDLAAAMKETTNALRKGGADMLSALQTIAAAESLQKRKTEHAERGGIIKEEDTQAVRHVGNL